MQESLDTSLVRIRTADGRVVGAGFLVGERQVLTCAHVVVKALGLNDQPSDAPQGLVSLDFPLVAPRMLLTARVVLWHPALSDDSGDIAGLELQNAPPVGAEVVHFAPAEDVWEHPFRALGFPAGYDDGVWATGHLLGRQATGWVMIEDVKAQGFAVGPGFSGTPVWDTQLQGVVGMIVAASRLEDTKAAFVLPLNVLVAAWPHIEPITRQRIFLSAAPADANFAIRLAKDLQMRGMIVWIEQYGLAESSTNREERIRQAIRAAQAVVLLASSETRSSRTVKEHLHLADVYSRRLILVWVGDTEHAQSQPYGWRETVWVDAHDTPYETALDLIEANLELHRSISALLGVSGVGAGQEPRNPYKGLRAFTRDDAGDFFGRDRLVDELIKDVARLVTAEPPATNVERLLTIIGPSGSGKSSIVMAGLLPRLQHGALSKSQDWVYLEPLVPGKHPIEALALTLSERFPDRSFTSIREDLEDDATRGLHVLGRQLAKQRSTHVMLLVDQFEELFTQTESEEERRRFIDLLLIAVTEPQGPLIVVLTMRADFYDRLLHYPALARLIENHHQTIFPMEVEDLRAVVEQPAALPDVQLSFEGNLVGDLLFETQGQVGALPLLQFTLAQLFERRSGHTLTLQAYREIGGVKGALAKHAESAYEALPSEEQRKLARALFLRLIDPGLTAQDTTRRRAALSELTLPTPRETELLQQVTAHFLAARLLTTNEITGIPTIEVSHEALIREWIRLSDWLREAREDIRQQQKLSADVAAWEQRGKPKDRLYRGSQLKEAQAWARRNTASEMEVAFLRTCTAQRTQYFVTRIATVLLVLLLLLPTAVALIRPPWCPTILCPPSRTITKPITPQLGMHDANLDLWIVAIQSTSYVIPGSPAQYSLNHLPESISAMRTDGRAIDPNTRPSPYLVVLGVQSLQQGNQAIRIEGVALTVQRALPLSHPLNVWGMGLSSKYSDYVYQVTYRGQEQGALLNATSVPGSYVQLKPGEENNLDIQIVSLVSIDLQFKLQVTYHLVNGSQSHTLTWQQVFEIVFFSSASQWHLYRLQGGHFVAQDHTA